MKKSMPNSETELAEERTFLSLERNSFSEERTFLAYIQTELAFAGLAILILKFYFDQHPWSIPLTVILIVFVAVMIALQSFRVKKLRQKRRELQQKHTLGNEH